MLKKENYIKQIDQILALLLVQITLRGYQQLYDMHVISEDFTAGLLNLVFGYSLENLNHLRANYPGIDLGDSVNGIAFQVTAEKSNRKIQETIDKFVQERLYEAYPQLMFFILAENYNPRSSFDTRGHFIFDKRNHILDFGKLGKRIRGLETERLEEIVQFFDTEVSAPRKQVESLYSLQGLLDELPAIKKLGFYDPEFQSWHSAVKQALRQIFGEDSYQVTEYDKIAWHTSDAPEDQEEQQRLFMRSCVAAEGILRGTIRLAPLFEANSSQPKLDASQLSLYPHRNPPYNAVKMLYTGNEIAKDLEVRVMYQEPDGSDQMIVVEEFFPEQDPKMIWHHNKYDFLKANQVAYFRLPRSESTLEGRATVVVRFVVASSGKSVEFTEEFELEQ